MVQRPPEQSEPLFRFVAFAFSGTLRWSLPRMTPRELRAYPRLIHIGGKDDHLLKNVSNPRLSPVPLPITFVICTSIYLRGVVLWRHLSSLHTGPALVLAGDVPVFRIAVDSDLESPLHSSDVR